MEKAALSGERRVVVVEIPAAAGRVPLGALQNGELEAAVRAQQAGDAGGVVGGVRLKGAAFQGLGKGAALQKAVPHGVRLVPVGDDEVPARFADGVVDDEAGVRHFGGVMGLRADAVLRGDKDPVP